MSIGSVYRPFLEVAREQGVDVDALLLDFALTYDSLVEQNTRLTPDQGRALAAAIARALPDTPRSDEIGLHAAERFMTGDAHLVGYLMESSGNALEAALALSSHARLLGDSADYRVEEAGDRVTLCLGLQGKRAMAPQGADFVVAALFRTLRERTRGRTLPLEVRIARATPKRPEVYRRFFGAPVVFGVDAGALVFRRDAMLAPFPAFDRRLARILSQHAATLLGQVPPSDSLSDRARALIVEGLAQGDITIERIAWRCGLGERTLRRRLAEAGTSFRALLDEVRKERALALLEQEGNVALVAQSLGFSDSTAFARAFRRWTRSLPHQHLRGLKTEPIES